VVEYDLSYNAAQDAIDYYCPYGKAAIRESNTVKSATPRPATPVNQ